MQLLRANLERIFAWTMAGLIIGYFITQLAFVPHEINPDEGINLIKGSLLADGYKFILEIWSDQPPFLSWLYSIFLNFFPKTILYARYLMVFFASLMSLGLFGLIYKKTNPYIAVLALTFILFLCPVYSFFFNAIMIGMPAIALLVMAMFLIYEKSDLSHASAVVAGLLAAFSLQTKFFTILGIVWILVYLLMEKRPAILASFTAAFAAVNLFMVFKFNLHKFQILISPHLKLSFEHKFDLSQRLGFINLELGTFFLVMYFIAVGFLLFKKKSWAEVIIPLGWSLTAFISILWHSPLWQHHLLIFIVPALWCIAIGLHGMLSKISFDNKFLLPGFGVVTLVSLSFFKVHTHVRNELMLQSYKEVTEIIRSQAPGEERPSVFSDRPIYAYLSDAKYPPKLACISDKRIKTHFLTEAWMLEYLNTNPTKFIIISRFYEFFDRPDLQNYILQHYNKMSHSTLHSKNLPISVYVRK